MSSDPPLSRVEGTARKLLAPSVKRCVGEETLCGEVGRPSDDVERKSMGEVVKLELAAGSGSSRPSVRIRGSGIGRSELGLVGLWPAGLMAESSMLMVGARGRVGRGSLVEVDSLGSSSFVFGVMTDQVDLQISSRITVVHVHLP